MNDEKKYIEPIKTGKKKAQSTSKLINAMVHNDTVQGAIKVFPNDSDEEKRNIITRIGLWDTPEVVLNSGGQITFDALDKMIFDTIFTFMLRGIEKFTVNQVIREFANSNKTIRPEHYDEIERRIISMSNTKVMVDATAEYKARGISYQKNIKRISREDALLPVRRVEVEFRNGVSVMGFEIYEESDRPLFNYVYYTKQYAAVPTQCYGAIDVKDSNERSIVERYLLAQIANMKTSPKRCRRIRFDSYEEDRDIHGLYNFMHLRKEAYAGTAWQNKKKKIEKLITDVLEHQISIGYIKGYEYIRENNNSIAYAVDIIL